MMIINSCKIIHIPIFYLRFKNLFTRYAENLAMEPWFLDHTFSGKKQMSCFITCLIFLIEFSSNPVNFNPLKV